MADNIFDIDFDDSKSLVTIQNKGDRRMGKGDRRMGVDRRLFSYSLHIPERRTGKDQRTGKDRRKLPR
jgi:hypothetical protein